jgi:hypothetical protein
MLLSGILRLKLILFFGRGATLMKDAKKAEGQRQKR